MWTAKRHIDKLSGFRLTTAHAGLIFDKYKKPENNNDKKEEAKKSLVLKTAKQAKVGNSYTKYFNFWKNSINSIDESYHVASAEIRVKGRMLIGVGEESTIETGITIHRTYGLPYIPGSSLKGLASAYAHKYLEPDEADWKKGDKDGNGRGDAQEAIFGSTEQAGDVIFFDALPNPNHIPNQDIQEWKGCWLVPDIITVHHQDYYSNKDNSPPADWDDPNPIPLLSAVGEYWLVVAGKDNNAVEAAFNLLKFGLEFEGIGAKTAIGYGKMEKVKI